MGYVVVAVTIVNVLALIALGVGIWYVRWELLTNVQTVILDEVRRQDDRIEKRLAKGHGASANSEEPPTPITDALLPGRPYRR